MERGHEGKQKGEMELYGSRLFEGAPGSVRDKLPDRRI